MKKLVMLCGMLFATVGYCEYKITEVKPISPWAVVVEVEGDEDYAPHLIASNTVTHQVTSCEKQKVTRRAEGMYSIRWNFFEDNENWDRCNIAFGIVGKYCVIDLSAGDKATSYPVTYLSDVPVGGWTDEYKTNKLVLRLIDSGSFKMCGKYDVTLTKPYYIGVFEVTQKQYQLVTGKQPSDFSGGGHCRDDRAGVYRHRGIPCEKDDPPLEGTQCRRKGNCGGHNSLRSSQR